MKFVLYLVLPIAQLTATAAANDLVINVEDLSSVEREDEEYEYDGAVIYPKFTCSDYEHDGAVMPPKSLLSDYEHDGAVMPPMYAISDYEHDGAVMYQQLSSNDYEHDGARTWSWRNAQKQLSEEVNIAQIGE